MRKDTEVREPIYETSAVLGPDVVMIWANSNKKGAFSRDHDR